VKLTDVDVDAFQRDGFVLLSGAYNVATEVLPIWRGVHDVIGLVADEHGVALGRPPLSDGPAWDAVADHFDDGYQELIAHDRALGGVVYDAVKQLAPFVRLTASTLHESITKRLRSTELVGIAGGGSGIRIDNPAEDRYRAPWHQEYPAQFRSLDGIVFWSPLRPLDADLGPVEICVGSHTNGVRRVVREDAALGREGAYAVLLENEAAAVEPYAKTAPMAQPGDVLVIDFLTIHRSGVNRSSKARWTMQSRCFTFTEPTGRRIGWIGSFAAGRTIADVHPELDADLETPGR
jgi:hypothetical protein